MDDYKYIDEDELEDIFNEYIDEFHTVEILGMSYFSSTILKELDPIAYNCELANWIDSERDILEELEESRRIEYEGNE